MTEQLELYARILRQAARRPDRRVFAEASIMRELESRALVRDSFYRDNGMAFATATRLALRWARRP